MSLIGLAVLGKCNEPLYTVNCENLLQAMCPSTDSSDVTANAHFSDLKIDPFGFFQDDGYQRRQRNYDDESSSYYTGLSLPYLMLIHGALDRMDELVDTGAGSWNKNRAGMPVRRRDLDPDEGRAVLLPSSTSQRQRKTANSSSTVMAAAANSGTVSSGASSHRSPTLAASTISTRGRSASPVPAAASVGATTTPNTPQWLGLLLEEAEQYAVYGYITATNIKFFALINWMVDKPSSNKSVANPVLTVELRDLLRAVHGHYVSYVMNPLRPVAVQQSSLQVVSTAQNRARDADWIRQNRNTIQSPYFDRNVRASILEYEARCIERSKGNSLAV